MRDLLNLQLVCKDFYRIISSWTSLWAHACFTDVWPGTESCLNIFYRSSRHGNFEAVVKLALAKMYNHGLPPSVLESYLPENGCAMAAAMEVMQLFHDAEVLARTESPFTWAFFRPPWAESIMCCKSCIFVLMKEALDQAAKMQSATSKDLLPYAASVAIILRLQGRNEEEFKYCQMAAQLGSSEAQLEVFHRTYASVIGDENVDPSVKLEAMRQLRQIASKGDHNACLLVASLYARAEYGGIGHQTAMRFTQRLFQSAKPILHKRQNSYPSDASRHILVDWMAEVATMKNLDCHTLCNAVAIVDRCVAMREIQRDKWQLLGVAALVIISRLSKDPQKSMMTIKEAAWLTDNTYTYEMVVRMVGEIMAALKGKMTLTTAHEYSRIPAVVDMESKDLAVVDYILELCLLHVSNSIYSQAEMAVAAILLARILTRKAVTYPKHFEEVTGFSIRDVNQCALDIYEKCFLSPPQYDHRLLQMEAVKLRHSAENSEFNVAFTELISRNDMEAKLGIVEDSMTSLATNTMHRLRRLSRAKELICSPSRGDRTRRPSFTNDVSREEAATPPPELDSSLFEQEFFADDEMEIDVSLDNSFLRDSSDSSTDTGDDDSLEEEGTVNFNLPDGTFRHWHSVQGLRGFSRNSCKNNMAEEKALTPLTSQQPIKQPSTSRGKLVNPEMYGAALVADLPESEEMFRQGIESPTRTSQRLAAKKMSLAIEVKPSESALVCGTSNDGQKQDTSKKPSVCKGALANPAFDKGTFICHPIYCIQRLQQIHTIFLQVPHHQTPFENIRLEPTEHYPRGLRIPLQDCRVHALSGKGIEICPVCSKSRAAPENLANLSLKGTPDKRHKRVAVNMAPNAHEQKTEAGKKKYQRPQRQRCKFCEDAVPISCSHKMRKNKMPSMKCGHVCLRNQPKRQWHKCC